MTGWKFWQMNTRTNNMMAVYSQSWYQQLNMAGSINSTSISILIQRLDHFYPVTAYYYNGIKIIVNNVLISSKKESVPIGTDLPLS